MKNASKWKLCEQIQRKHKSNIGFSAVLSELVTTLLKRTDGMPTPFPWQSWAWHQAPSWHTPDCHSSVRPSCLLHILSCGPAETRTQPTCSYFLSPQTRHWTAVRLGKLLFTFNLWLIWTTELGSKEKSTFALYRGLGQSWPKSQALGWQYFGTEGLFCYSN